MSVTSLPPELLQRIFGFLSGRKSDIRACRRVCTSFRDHSSEFLVTRVAFARRRDTVESLRELLDHPYFHRHVTELVYDASRYQEDIAEDFEQYVAACEGHFESFGDKEATPHCVRPYRFTDTDHDTAKKEGFHDYCRRLQYQMQMIKDRSDIAIVQEVLKKLPKLHRIVFADFRELAREREHYSTTCERMFGNTLEPVLGEDTFFEPLEPRLYPKALEHFWTIIRQVAAHSGAKIRSLSIGGQKYNDLDCDCVLAAPAVRADTLCSDTDLHFVEIIFKNLRHLQLPVHFSGIVDSTDTFVGQSLRFAAPCLVRLSLFASGLFEIGQPESQWLDRGARRILEDLLLPLTFGSLQHLDLQGWPLPEGVPLQKFLSKHSSKLRELRCTECVVFEDPMILAQWASKNMTLRGVELLVYHDDCNESSNLQIWRNVDLCDVWLSGMPNDLAVTHHLNVDPGIRHKFISRRGMRCAFRSLEHLETLRRQ